MSVGRQDDRHALVTGAASGIGLEITRRLVTQGWRVTGLDRQPVACPGVDCRAVDLSDEAALSAELASLVQVDAVVHAAGFMAAAPLGCLDPEVGRRLWQVHVQAAALLVDVLAGCLPDVTGRVVLIGSRTAAGMAGRSQYAACKAALVGLARSWAAELAPRGVTVNIVAPGATRTPMLDDPSRRGSMPVLPPMGRYVEPSEVAAAVCFLLGSEAGSITGQQLVLCGGGSLA